MFFFILAYLGGAMTILAPCILPVLPFVFARVDRPFKQSGLPLLVGMAITFAGVSTLGAVAGNWAVQANDYGRIAAYVMLALIGVALLAPQWTARLTRPLVALGSRLANAADAQARPGGRPALSSFGLGVATGLLWAPCAGPILGLILTGAALQGPSVHTTLLLLSYAAGAVSSLALALLAGGRVFAVLKRSLGVGEWLRKGLGVAVLAGVVTVALGLDTGLLAQLSSGSGGPIEKALLQQFGRMPAASAAMKPMASASTATDVTDSRFLLKVADRGLQTALPVLPALPVEGAMPPLAGAVEWLNSAPLTAEQLKGKVVLVAFWTFGCINCRNALPYVKEWNRQYKDQGLVVIGVHSPEFAYEKNIGNVKKALVDLGISFPVAVDNNFAIWRAFGNNYWPAHYFVDGRGRIRFHHFGEGEYEKSEQVIQQLLEEARKDKVGSS